MAQIGTKFQAGVRKMGRLVLAAGSFADADETSCEPLISGGMEDYNYLYGLGFKKQTSVRGRIS